MAREYEEQRMPRELQDLRRGKEGAAAEGEREEKEERIVGSSLCSASYSIYSLSSFVTCRWQRKLAGKAGYLLRYPAFATNAISAKCPRCDPRAEMLQRSRECFGIRTRTRLMYRRRTNHGKCTRWIRHVCIFASCSFEWEMKYSCSAFCYLRYNRYRYFIR